MYLLFTPLAPLNAFGFVFNWGSSDLCHLPSTLRPLTSDLSSLSSSLFPVSSAWTSPRATFQNYLTKYPIWDTYALYEFN